MLKFFISLGVLFVSLTSCSQSKNETDCSAFPGQGSDIKCGYLSVPENREKDNGKNIQIAYMVLKAESDTPSNDAIVFLQGGPGGAGIDLFNFWRNHPLREDRDIILVDQRGTGRSKPALCAEFGNELMSVLSQNLDLQGEKIEIEKLIDNCKSTLLDQQVDLTAYNSRENAADIEVLRDFLGYEQWNIWGGSYGTRLGLTIMRDYPQGIRSAILVGPFPLHVNLYESLMPNFKQSLFKVFEQCRDEKKCSEKYPELREDFYSAIKALREKPMKLKLNGGEFWLNAQDLLLLIHQSLYSRNTIANIPELITSVKAQDASVILDALEAMLQRAGSLNYGMYFSVQAYEELPFNDYQSYNEGLNSAEGFEPGLAFFSSDIQLLDKWHSSRAEARENEPVKSTIPTLIMVGEFDPITPSVFGEESLRTLENGQMIVFPGNGHGIFNSCAYAMMERFLANPELVPDKNCLDKIRPIRFK